MKHARNGAYPQSPVGRTRHFWPLLGNARHLGLFGGFVALAFLAVTSKKAHRFTLSNTNTLSDIGGWWS
jgi:hypothetical protein